MTSEVITFGCRLNSYESEVMKNSLKNLDMEDVLVFNTCSVTKEAERQARQAIRKARRKNPNAKIVVTGCSAQINSEQYASMDEVDQVIGNSEKFELPKYLASSEKVISSDIMTVTETAPHMLVEGLEGRARAFVQVQNGCDHRCTFCIIPYGRGNSRSVPIGSIVEQVKKLVDSGYREIVFTGVDVTSYGSDLPGKPSLGQMTKRVLNLVPELPRLRFSSIDVAEIDDELFELFASNERVMPHVHISLQAGDDMVLKRMKRRHSRNDVIEFCDRLRQKRDGISFGADIIAGFPTETDQMFQNTLDLVKEANLQYLHVFPYSEREGTPAAKMPQVENSIRKKRAALLRLEGQKQLQKYLDNLIGTKIKAVVEKEDFARGECFAGIRLKQKAQIGEVISTNIVASDGENLIGEVIC